MGKTSFLFPGPWSTLVSFWFTSLFRSSPLQVFSCAFAFPPGVSLPFILPYSWPSAPWRGLYVFHVPPWSLVPSQAPLSRTFWPKTAICFFYLKITLRHIVFPNFLPNSGSPFLSFLQTVQYLMLPGKSRTGSSTLLIALFLLVIMSLRSASETLPHLFFACTV